jgi:hypothetical protein
MIGEIIMNTAVGVAAGNALAVQENVLGSDVAGSVGFRQRSLTPVELAGGLGHALAISVVGVGDAGVGEDAISLVVFSWS